MAKNKDDSVKRLDVLKMIGDCLFDAMQWSKYKDPSCAHFAVSYYDKAESLIELLEIHDCKSVGGFDKGQPHPGNIFDRFDWLCKKYHDPEKIKFACGISSYQNLRDYFKEE